MKNKEAIKHVYDEIHAPDALFGKVMEMDKRQSKMRNIMKYAVGTAAAFAIAMITSNGICYAATGETWISKAIVYINGEATEQDITWRQNGDLFYGEVEVPVDAGEGVQVREFSIVTEDKVPHEVLITAEEGSALDSSVDAAYTQDEFSVEVEEVDGKVYLVTETQRIDITKEFSDGEATGTFEYEGLTVRYTVTGTVEECEVQITCE